ncbi:MAG: hypothetical protein WC510_02025 [Candidatus Omnitrophota bacterium]
MPVRGTELVIKNIRNFGGGFLKHVNRSMKEVSGMLKEEIQQNISLQDHSLESLRRMGHPYRIVGPGLHHPESYKVHIQSGQLVSSLKQGVQEANIEFMALKAGAWAGVDENIAPHALYVFYGTSKMIPRDFLSPALKAAGPRALVYLKDNLRDAIINFKPEK